MRTRWRRAADQVHLDARLAPRSRPRGGANAPRSKSPPSSRLMRTQQVAVERGRHAERIVVGQQQLALRLHQIGAEQQRVARRAAPRGSSRRNASAPGGSKLPMFEPRNSDQRAAGAAAARRRPRRGPLRRSPGACTTSTASGASSAASVGWPGRAPPARCRSDARSARRPCTPAGLDQRRQLLAAAGAELDDASTTGSTRARISRPCRVEQARSARVMRYHGSWQIASKSAEPSAS